MNKDTAGANRIAQAFAQSLARTMRQDMTPEERKQYVSIFVRTNYYTKHDASTRDMIRRTLAATMYRPSPYPSDTDSEGKCGDTWPPV